MKSNKIKINTNWQIRDPIEEKERFYPTLIHDQSCTEFETVMRNFVI